MRKSGAVVSVVAFALAGLAGTAACGTDDTAAGSSDPGGGSSGTSGASGSVEGGPGPTTDGAAVPDGEVDAGPYVPPAACTRGAEAVTAPASLYDTLVADLASLTGDARTARIDAFVAAVATQGGTPLEDPKTGRTVFVVRGAPASGTWSVVGSWDGFDTSKRLALGAIAGTDLFVLDQSFPRTTSLTYKLLDGTDAGGIVDDPLARNVVWDGLARGGMMEANSGRFNAVIHASALPMTRGRLTVHGRVHAAQLANDRRVFVYFPPKYDDGTCSKLPSIVFQDGNETITRGDYPGLADALYAADPALSSVLVFAELAPGGFTQRAAEYTFGASTKGLEYVDFLTADLWPEVTARYRLCSLAAARGISGVSFGGLIATFAAFEKPLAWGWVGAQSASYWYGGDALVTRVSTTTPRLDVRFFLDSSDQPTDNVYDVDKMKVALDAKGYTSVRIKTVVADPNAHDWAYFKLRGTQLLTDFRSGIAACD